MAGGGVERCLLNILNRIDLQKYKITVLAIMSGGELENSIPKGIEYRYCWKRKFEIFGKRIPGTDRMFQLLFAACSEKLLHTIFIRESFDVEIDYWGQEGLKLILGSSPDTKKIVFIHSDMNTESMRNSNFPYKTKEKLRNAYLRADMIANVSKDCRQSMIDRFELTGSEQEKLIISYNVNLSDQIVQKAKEFVNLPFDNCKILCASGRLYPVKGFDRLIKICARLRDDGICFGLMILGEGKERETLEKIIKENKLQDYVKLLGFQNNPYKYMARADAFICSSFFEGFSTVVSEAVVLGVPTVTTDCTGAREILGDSEYGIVTELDDESLYEGIRKILSDEVLYKYYQEKVKERQQFFDVNVRMKEFEALL
jgi:glycosyltransferase involved in cell wall biosynthesis